MLLALGLKGFDSIVGNLSSLSPLQNQTTTFFDEFTTTVISELFDETSESVEEIESFEVPVFAPLTANMSDLTGEDEFLTMTTSTGSQGTTQELNFTALDVTIVPEKSSSLMEDLIGNMAEKVSESFQLLTQETTQTIATEETTQITKMTTLGFNVTALENNSITNNALAEEGDASTTLLNQETFDNQQLTNFSTVNELKTTAFYNVITTTNATTNSENKTAHFEITTLLPQSSIKSSFFDDSGLATIITAVCATTLVLIMMGICVYLLWKFKPGLRCCDEYEYYRCWYSMGFTTVSI